MPPVATEYVVHEVEGGDGTTGMEPLRLHEVTVTVVLLLVLGGVFLLGFSEAVGVAIPLDRVLGAPLACSRAAADTALT